VISLDINDDAKKQIISELEVLHRVGAALVSVVYDLHISIDLISVLLLCD